MSVTSTNPKADEPTDRWVRLPATWEAYLRLVKARGDANRPRYTYLDGRLTVVSPGHRHESLKTRLTALIDEVLVALSIDFHASGEVTLWRSRRPRSGAEADASYYFSGIGQVLGKADLVMGEDPPPDLVIEVVVSHPEGDALDVYRGFGVREVWVCRKAGLEFLVLGDDGEYHRSPASAALPFLTSEELGPWVFRSDPAGEVRVRRQFRVWVERTLAPRLGPPND